MNQDYAYEVAYPDRKRRRDSLKARGLCICGPDTLVSINAHGPIVSGGRCQRCQDVARASR